MEKLKLAMTDILSSGCTLAAEPQSLTYVLDASGQRPEPRVAVEQVCAWPNLTLLPDGTIIALIYNQPSHGKMPGDVECWASTDEGGTWERRSVAAPRGADKQNRMNVAAGLTPAGTLILASSGWSEPGNPEAEGRADYGHIRPVLLSCSDDGGTTWTTSKTDFPLEPGNNRQLVPFGDIMPGKDGKLRVSAYNFWNYIIRGDGKTWDEPVRMSKSWQYNEAAILYLGGGHWLAAARQANRGLHILYSEDDALTWNSRGEVTGNMMHPGHLIRLDTGAILLTYGNRNSPYGVEVLFSDDEGRTWSKPYRILDTEPGDMGYPSSVQLKDGPILTAYYARGIASYRGYHMGVVTWDPVRTRGQ